MTTMTQLTSHDYREEWTPVLELATREVFELMLGCRLASPEAGIEKGSEITAMVGLAGRLCGVLSIRCEEKSAKLMASKMLRIETESTGPQMADALGEICNMVAGNFKQKIAGLGDSCMLSPPTVISGTDYNLYSLADSPGLEVRLLFEDMPITVILQVHS